MLFRSVRSVKVILGVLNNAICEANHLEMVDYVTEDDKKKNVVREEKEPKEETNENVQVEVMNTTNEDLNKKTLAELKAMAKDAQVKGYSTMKKDELIASLSKN